MEKTPKALHRGETFERLLICVKEHWVTDSDMDIEKTNKQTNKQTNKRYGYRNDGGLDSYKYVLGIYENFANY